MSTLDQIPFSADARTKIETSLVNYQRFARIQFTFDLKGPVLAVHAEQQAAPTGRILTREDLVERAKGVFDGLMPEGYSYYITAKALDQ